MGRRLLSDGVHGSHHDQQTGLSEWVAKRDRQQSSNEVDSGDSGCGLNDVSRLVGQSQAWSDIQMSVMGSLT